MTRRFIRLRTEHSLEEVDLEASSDRPVSELIPDILKVLGWPDTKGDQPLRYELRTEGGDLLEATMTLDQAEIENSDVLWIRLATGDDEEIGATIATGPGSAAARSEAPPPPVEASIEITSPSLVSARGVVFEIGKAPAIVGRASRHSSPEIDLTDLDPEFASSRRHARIAVVEEALTIEAMRTTNGTFVNGVELPPGESHALHSGDELQFGFEGVTLTFFTPGDALPSSFFK